MAAAPAIARRLLLRAAAWLGAGLGLLAGPALIVAGALRGGIWRTEGPDPQAEWLVNLGCLLCAAEGAALLALMVLANGRQRLLAALIIAALTLGGALVLLPDDHRGGSAAGAPARSALPVLARP